MPVTRCLPAKNHVCAEFCAPVRITSPTDLHRRIDSPRRKEPRPGNNARRHRLRNQRRIRRHLRPRHCHRDGSHRRRSSGNCLGGRPVYAVEGTSQSVAVIDASTNTVVDTIAVGGGTLAVLKMIARCIGSG
ncbi:hypothetical protein E5720_17975 [Rhodococcus sp. PAMC28707]|nr:hypothetical protein E5769_17550 [Rhodococcus sp. PAMC28705]QCB60092.1 hypothetical protein E5720_17975 [Rhodococcus sp. PAMC28707]